MLVWWVIHDFCLQRKFMILTWLKRVYWKRSVTIYLIGFCKPSQQINQACEKLQQVKGRLPMGEEMEVFGGGKQWNYRVPLLSQNDHHHFLAIQVLIQEVVLIFTALFLPKEFLSKNRSPTLQEGVLHFRFTRIPDEIQ